VKDGKDPNIRCMGGGSKCLVNPKYKDFKNSVSKTSAECYSGFMHGAGKKDPICRRLLKPTNYSNTQCFGPKGKDGNRPKSCDLTNTLIDAQIGLTNNLTDAQINMVAKEICENFDHSDNANLEADRVYEKLIREYKEHISFADEVKIMAKMKAANCFKTLEITPNQGNEIEEITQLPPDKQIEALENLIQADPDLEKKIVETSRLTNILSPLVNNPVKSALGLGAVGAAALGATFLINSEDTLSDNAKNLVAFALEKTGELRDFTGKATTAAGKFFKKSTKQVKNFINTYNDPTGIKGAVSSLTEGATTMQNEGGALLGAVAEGLGTIQDSATSLASGLGLGGSTAPTAGASVIQPRVASLSTPPPSRASSVTATQP
jgi:hypothetical protein